MKYSQRSLDLAAQIRAKARRNLAAHQMESRGAAPVTRDTPSSPERPGRESRGPMEAHKN
jgi:hypothetical protein